MVAENRIHQMQMSFVPMEDRILFRMSTANKEEFRLWLTRRYVKLLWQVLQDMLNRATLEHIAPTANPLAREAIKSFEHQRAIANTNFSSQYEEALDMKRPLGATPVLVSRIRVHNTEDSGPVLSMHPEDGHGIEIVMNEQLLHSFIGLLVKTLTTTDWNLPYSLDDPMHTMSHTPGSGQKVALH